VLRHPGSERPHLGHPLGDALTAGVVFGLLNDFPVDEAVRLGVSAAALTLQCKETVYPDLSLEILYDQLVI
jgi:pseudouridine kinase